MSDSDLLDLARDFRDGLLARRDSGGWCAAVSYALQGYLSFFGIETTIGEIDTVARQFIAAMKVENG